LKSFFLLFNHTLTEDQKKKAIEQFGDIIFINFPEHILRYWSQIPPELTSLKNHLSPVFKFIEENGKKGDIILIHGDFGAVFLAVNFCLKHGLIPVYSTTKREIIKEIDSDGLVKINRTFKHVIFRKYEIF
jgi:hypothetical protein